MSDTILSFRCNGEQLKIARQICRDNKITLTDYALAALVHYVYAKVQQGELKRPPFFDNLPKASDQAPGM